MLRDSTLAINDTAPSLTDTMTYLRRAIERGEPAMQPATGWDDDIPLDMKQLGPHVIATLRQLGWQPEYGRPTLAPSPYMPDQWDWTWSGRAEQERDRAIRTAINRGSTDADGNPALFNGPIPDWLMQPTDAADTYDWHTPAMMRDLPPAPYHIPGILRADQPALIGGALKAMKTSTTLDLAISLATGTPFLGRAEWRPAEPIGVTMLTGESGLNIICESGRLICDARGMDWFGVSYIRFSTRIPQFDDAASLDKLAREVEQHGSRVLIVDPAYFAMPSENTGVLTAQAKPLTRFSRTFLGRGITPVIVHHAKKPQRDSRAAMTYSPLNLPDVAGAGYAEWAGQWLLLGRRRAYEYDGHHELWLTHGTRGGDAGEWAVDIDEQTQGPRLGPAERCWRVAVRSRTVAREEAERDARLASGAQLETDMAAVLAYLDATPGRPRSGNEMQQDLDRSRPRINAAIAQLRARGTIHQVSRQAGYQRVSTPHQ